MSLNGYEDLCCKARSSWVDASLSTILPLVIRVSLHIDTGHKSLRCQTETYTLVYGQIGVSSLPLSSTLLTVYLRPRKRAGLNPHYTFFVRRSIHRITCARRKMGRQSILGRHLLRPSLYTNRSCITRWPSLSTPSHASVQELRDRLRLAYL